MIEKAWGLVPPPSWLAKIQGAASWCLQKIREVGALHGASGKLDKCLQKEVVGASC